MEKEKSLNEIKQFLMVNLCEGIASPKSCFCLPTCPLLSVHGFE